METLKDPKEIEKEMDRCRVITLGDIYRALRDHPDWAQELRRVFLTEELLELPRKFQKFLEEDFYPLKSKVEKIEKDVDTLKQDVSVLKEDVAILKEDVAVLKQDVAVLKEDVAVLKQDVAVLKEDVAVLKQDVAMLKQDVAMLKKDMAYIKGEFGRFKGKEFERTIRERYFAYFGKILRKSKRIELESLLPKIEELFDQGVIDDKQFDSILQIDLIVEGQIRKNGKPVVLAIEISYSIHSDDLTRAEERAQILATVLNKEVIPTVLGVEVDEQTVSQADERGILLIRTEY